MLCQRRRVFTRWGAGCKHAVGRLIRWLVRPCLALCTTPLATYRGCGCTVVSYFEEGGDNAGCGFREGPKNSPLIVPISVSSEMTSVVRGESIPTGALPNLVCVASCGGLYELEFTALIQPKLNERPQRPTNTRGGTTTQSTEYDIIQRGGLDDGRCYQPVCVLRVHQATKTSS